MLPPSLYETLPSEGSQWVPGRCWHQSHSDRRRNTVSYTDTEQAPLQKTNDTLVKHPVPESELCFLLWCWTQSSKPPSWWTPWDCWGGGVNMVVLNSSRLPKMTNIQTDLRPHLILYMIPDKLINEDIKWVTEPLPESGCHLLLQCCPLHVKQEKQLYSHCACKNTNIVQHWVWLRR